MQYRHKRRPAAADKGLLHLAVIARQEGVDVQHEEAIAEQWQGPPPTPPPPPPPRGPPPPPPPPPPARGGGRAPPPGACRPGAESGGGGGGVGVEAGPAI